MSLFKKEEVVSVSVEVPGCEQAPHQVLATEWSQCVGLSEWDKCLKDADPADVIACLQKVRMEKDKEWGAIWILLSAYRKQHEERMCLETKVLELESLINVLNKEIKTLKVSDKKAAEMLVSNQIMLAESKQLRIESEQLSDRLKTAESSVCVQSDASISDKAGHCKSVMCTRPEKRNSRANVCPIREGNVSCRYKSTQPVIKRRIVRCFSCGRLGHIAKYCRFSGSEMQKRDSNVKCFLCHLVGHIAKNCPTQKRKRVTVCYTCGQTGHISRNCYSTKSEAWGLRPQQNDGPEMGGTEKENSSSWWRFKHRHNGHREHSHWGPFSGG